MEDGPFPLRLGEYSETWHTKKFKKIAYATKLHQAQQENARIKHVNTEQEDMYWKLKVENEKLKATATGWRPLLEKVLVMNEMWGDLPGEFIKEIKTFLYGE